jgi:hypothetical protein
VWTLSKLAVMSCALMGAWALPALAQKTGVAGASKNAREYLNEMSADPTARVTLGEAMQDPAFRNYLDELDKPGGNIALLWAVQQKPENLQALQLLATDTTFATLMAEKQKRSILQSLKEGPAGRASAPAGQQQAWQRIGEQTSDLQDLVSRSGGNADGYYHALSDYAYYLEAARRITPGERQARLLADIGTDLEIKLEFAKMNKKGPVPYVAVSVRTKDGSKEESGYEVFYATRFDAEVGREFRPMKTHSSPARDQFAAGEYVLYCQRGSEQGPRRAETIGKGGATDVELDLPIR